MRCTCCGTCCRNGPPGLHPEDSPLYFEGVLQREHLLTLRRGERVRDNVAGAVVVLQREMIRIKSRSDSLACMLLKSENHCPIYERRPAQCRALACWDTDELKRVYRQQSLSRSDLISPHSALAGIIGEHEQGCSPDRLRQLVQQVREKGDREGLQEIGLMLSRDREFRRYLRDRAGAEGALEFILGRSLEAILWAEGIRVEESGGGYRLREDRLERAGAPGPNGVAIYPERTDYENRF